MSAQYSPSPHDLYGGFFDITRGEGANIDLSEVKAALLLYDKIVVPDNFFTAKGAFVDQLLKETFSPGILTILLKQGLIVPALRKGNSLRENWLLGPSVGIDPGRYLTISKQNGDVIFDCISDYSDLHVKWPPDMAEAKNNNFGQMCFSRVIRSNEVIGDISNISSRLRSHYSSAADILDLKRAENLLRDYTSEIQDNYQSAQFRRGMIENRLARSLGWIEKGDPKFDYNRVWNEPGITGRVLRGLVRITSTVYEFYQATELSTSVAFVDHRDPTTILEFKSDNAINSGYASTFSVELFPLVDFVALSFERIAALRTRFREDTFAELRARRLSFLSNPDLSNFEKLFSFANGPVLEMIKQESPESIRRPARRIVEGASLMMTAGGTTSSAIGVMPDAYVALTAGAIGVGVAKLESFSSWLGFADSVNGVAGRMLGTVDSGFSFFDRAILQSPKKRKLARRLVRELAVLNNDPDA